MSGTVEKDVYQGLTQKIVEAMERGVVPWVQPWTTTLPLNAISGRPYRGINVLSTWTHQLEGGYRSNAYVTYKQAQALGGNVRRGEHGVTVVYYKQIPKADDSVQAECQPRYWWLARGYTVFNLDQVDGVDELRARLSISRPADFEPIRQCDLLVERTGATIRCGSGLPMASVGTQLGCPIPQGWKEVAP